MDDDASTGDGPTEPYGNAPIPEKGDPSEDVVYAAVGYALSIWEAMEAELCWLYGALIDVPRYAPEAVIGYSQKPTLQGRLDQVLAAVEARAKKKPDHPLECDVHQLIKEVQKSAQSRNKIAHAIVVLLRQNFRSGLPGAMINLPFDQEYCLVPAYYNHRYVDPNLRPNYIYLSRDIRKIGGGFKDLQRNAHRLILNRFPQQPLRDA